MREPAAAGAADDLASLLAPAEVGVAALEAAAAAPLDEEDAGSTVDAGRLEESPLAVEGVEAAATTGVAAPLPDVEGRVSERAALDEAGVASEAEEALVVPGTRRLVGPAEELLLMGVETFVLRSMMSFP